MYIKKLSNLFTWCYKFECCLLIWIVKNRNKNKKMSQVTSRKCVYCMNNRPFYKQYYLFTRLVINKENNVKGHGIKMPINNLI